MILDALPEPIGYWNRHLVCCFANLAYLDLLGKQSETVVGAAMQDVLGETLFALDEPFIRAALGGERQAFGRMLTRADGERVHTVTTYIPTVISGEVDGFLVHVGQPTQAQTTEAAVGGNVAERAAADVLPRNREARSHDAPLDENQGFFERLGAAAGIGGWELDIPSGALTWSGETCRIHDLEPGRHPSLDEALGFCTPASRDMLERVLREGMADGHPWDLELELISAKGRALWARMTGTAEFKCGRPLRLSGTFQDITAAVLIKQQLKDKSNNLEATLDNIEQGLIKVTLDRKVQLANRRFVELLEIPPEMLKKSDLSFDDMLAYLDERGEYGNATEDLQRRVRDKGKPLVPGTHERIRPNGQILEVVTASLSDGSIVATYSDITGRRTAENALRESEARYRLLADTTSDIVAQLDLDLVWRYASPACRAMLGYEPEELIGLGQAATIHPDDVVEVEGLMKRLIGGGVADDRATMTSRIRHKQGHWVWLEAGINLVRDVGTGHPKALICSLRDVTERQRVARHLELAKAAAERAAHAKAEFLANMSHELRTPLTGIMGVLDVLRSDRTLGESQQRLVGLAADAGDSLLTIVNDVLDFSKIEEGQLTIEAVPFDLKALIERCADFTEESLNGKAITVATRLELGGPVTWIGDPGRLRQIVMNLLTNAVKFTERGRIEIVALYRQDSRSLHVEVSDTGIGIPPDRIESLFTRFTQADTSITRRYGGSGLGLAISRRLLDLMGGRIGVRSRPGGGSTFWFDVPLIPEENGAFNPLTSDSGFRAAKTLDILLVEDNALNRDIIKTMLGGQGHRVIDVADGGAAVEAAGAVAFDVIVMDVQMPGVDGLTATITLRAREQAEKRRRVPIVGLTANAMEDDVQRCLAAGMDGHVAKPIDWTILFDTLTEVCADAGTGGGKARLDETLPTFDPARLDVLAKSLGKRRVGELLKRFAEDLRHRRATLDKIGPADLASQAHSICGLAGTLGFMALAELCVSIEADARQGKGIDRLIELNDGLGRAIDATAASSYADGGSL